MPVFVNCVAEPLGPVMRARLLGAAVGRAAQTQGRRVLIMGSGGLSHDPPVPRIQDAPSEIAERLISGRNPAPEVRAARESGVVEAVAAFAAGASDLMPLNPEWDAGLMAMLACGDLESIDARPNDWFAANAGHSSHEVRTWIPPTPHSAPRAAIRSIPPSTRRSLSGSPGSGSPRPAPSPCTYPGEEAAMEPDPRRSASGAARHRNDAAPGTPADAA